VRTKVKEVYISAFVVKQRVYELVQLHKSINLDCCCTFYVFWSSDHQNRKYNMVHIKLVYFVHPVHPVHPGHQIHTFSKIHQSAHSAIMCTLCTLCTQCTLCSSEPLILDGASKCTLQVQVHFCAPSAPCALYSPTFLKMHQSAHSAHLCTLCTQCTLLQSHYFIWCIKVHKIQNSALLCILCTLCTLCILCT
jgi:hypothetical protein